MNKCLTEVCKGESTCTECRKCWFHCGADFYCAGAEARFAPLSKPKAEQVKWMQKWGSLESEKTTEGVKHDQEKDRYDLLPPQSINEVVKVLTFGAGKYGDRNWERGMNWSRLFGALNRHMWAWFSRQGKDSETKISHLAHAACCALMLLEYELRGTGKDDRPYGEVQ